jgi:hypothetical protein
MENCNGLHPTLTHQSAYHWCHGRHQESFEQANEDIFEEKIIELVRSQVFNLTSSVLKPKNSSQRAPEPHTKRLFLYRGVRKKYGENAGK